MTKTKVNFVKQVEKIKGTAVETYGSRHDVPHGQRGGCIMVYDTRTLLVLVWFSKSDTKAGRPKRPPGSCVHARAT